MKTIVNFKLLSFLFAISIVLHVAASAVHRSHPLLGILFAMLETVGWICVLLIWAIALIKGIQHWGRQIWKAVWMYARTHIRVKKAKELDTIVPVEQLKHLRTDVQRLGLALHGTTPEMENARRTHFQMLGAKIPDLVLPPQNAILYAQFQSLVSMLNHFGFPHLENVRLQQKELVFIQQWGRDLEAHLHHQQKCSLEQQGALRQALATVTQQHQTLGQQYASAQQYSGYQRIQGALRLLEKIVNDNRCQYDLAQSYVQALQQDIQALAKQIEQVVA